MGNYKRKTPAETKYFFFGCKNGYRTRMSTHAITSFCYDQAPAIPISRIIRITKFRELLEELCFSVYMLHEN